MEWGKTRLARTQAYTRGSDGQPDTERARGHGLGRLLLDELISACDNAGIWTIQSSIFPENDASLRQHELAGLRVVGHRERIALMTYGPWVGQWDTILIEWRRER